MFYTVPAEVPKPNRNTQSDYRYGYQGEFAEKEGEIPGVNSFELRLWDSRIGRWLTTDPANQYASPYLGMGNNPISMTDPDGGYCPDCPDPPAEIDLGTLNTVIITVSKSRKNFD